MNKDDFPLLKNHDVAYLDNGATTQRPRTVIQRVKEVQEYHNANPHRSNHDLAEEATEIVESARKTIADYINAEPDEVIFTKNCTEALNLATHILQQGISPDQRVVSTIYEHHSALLPLQRLPNKLRVARTTGELQDTLKEDVGLVSATHMSNVSGRKIDPSDLDGDHALLIDGCQSIPHQEIDVKQLRCDAFAFSMHKLFGPTGVGILYLNREHHDKEPLITGGGTVRNVTTHSVEYNESPHRFEAGTQNLAGIAGSQAAIEYLESLNREEQWKHEKQLADQCRDQLRELGCQLLDETPEAGPIISFSTGHNANDVATICNHHDVAIRGGTHCAQPYLNHLGHQTTPRISIAPYNDQQDIQKAIHAVQDAINILS
jgi:cysteine desulfurase/selenocysteine lyase